MKSKSTQGNGEAVLRVSTCKKQYTKNIYPPLWYDDPDKENDFRLDADIAHYGCVRYHAPILCTYNWLGNTRYKTFVAMYEREFDSISCSSQESYIHPPDG